MSVRCIVERAIVDSPVTSTTHLKVEMLRWTTLVNSMVSLPVDALFCDLARIVLGRLGFSGADVLMARGCVQLNNWRELDFSSVTLDSQMTLNSAFGEIRNAVTLHFKLPRENPDKLSIHEMRGRLFEFFLAKQINLPFEKDLFDQLMKGEAIMNEDRCQHFNKWTEDHSKVYKVRNSPHIVKHKLQRWFQSNEDVSRPSSEDTSEFNNADECPSSHRLPHSDCESNQIKTENSQIGPENEHVIAIPVPILPNRNAVYTINPLLGRDEMDCPFVKRARSSDEEEDVRATPELFKREQTSYHMIHSASNHAHIGNSTPYVAAFPAHTPAMDVAGRRLTGHEVEDLSMSAHGKRERDESPTSGGFGSSYTAAMYMEQHRRQMHMLHMAQFAQLNYLSGHVTSGTLTPATSCDTPTTPTSATGLPAMTAAAGSSTSLSATDMYEQRSLTPCSSTDEKNREDSLSAKKRSRVFIDPLTEIPKLEVWFVDDTHPSSYMIDKYTEELNKSSYRRRFPCLEAKNVQLWFKNHRAKVKRSRQELKAASDMLSRSLETPVSGIHQVASPDDDNNDSRGVCRNAGVSNSSGLLQVVAAV